MLKQYILVAVLVVCISCQGNDIGISGSLRFLDGFKNNIGPQFISEFIKQFNIPSINQTIKILDYFNAVNVNLTNLRFQKLDVDFKNMLISSQDQDLIIKAHNTNSTIATDYHIKSGFIKINGPIQIDLNRVELSIALKFIFDQRRATNLKINMVNFNFNYKDITINQKSQSLLDKVFQTLLNISFMKTFIQRQMKQQIQEMLNKLLMEKPFVNFKIPYTQSSYQAQIYPSEAPQFYRRNNEDYIDMKFKVELATINSGQRFKELNQREIGSRVGYLNDQQVLVSSNFLNKVAQMVNNSDILKDHVISNILIPESSPIQLYTDKVGILFPGMDDVYGVQKGIYLKTSKIDINNLVIVNARTVVRMGLGLAFYVDTDSSQYPQNITKIEQCSQCQKAVELKMQLMLVVYIGNKDKETFKVLVLDSKLESLDIIESSFDVNKKMLNDLIVTLIESQMPIIDEKLNKGIRNPLINQYGINSIQLRLGQDFLLASIDQKK